MVRKSGVSKSTLSRIEKSRVRKSNGAQAERLAEAFDLTAEDLTGNGAKQIVVAVGDFVPIRVMALKVSIGKDGLDIREKRSGTDDPDAQVGYLAFEGLAPDTLIIRADEG